jgi:transposase
VDTTLSVHVPDRYPIPAPSRKAVVTGRLLFSRIKQCRRIATRYDKLASTFMGFLKLACIMLWIK